jgi:GNAT superfamily N-acetyltransferase
VNDLHFQQATAAVTEELTAVYRSAFRENRRLGIPHVAESVSERQVADWIQQHTIYVAKRHSDVIGGVRLDETDPNRVKISRLAVHERWKRKGIGRQLLEYVEKQVRDCGYSTIWLTTPETHPYLPEMYRQRGYEKTGTDTQEQHGVDFVTMAKELG